MRSWLLATETKSSASELSRHARQESGDWDAAPSTITRLEVEAGDRVLLWRKGRGGGVVALGQIARAEPVTGDALTWPLIMFLARGETGRAVRLSLEKISFATPVIGPALRTAGLGNIVKQARSAGELHKLVAVDLTNEQWGRLHQLVDESQPPDAMPTAWNIPPGSVVKRRELHDVYGGNPRLTVGGSGRTPNSFLFLDPASAGELAHRWRGTVLVAPGQAQWTDGISHENLAVLAHQRLGLPLRIFVSKGSECAYLGEFAIDTESSVECWADTGKRDIGSSRRPLLVDSRTPLFRLRQLNGVARPANHESLFRSAPRLALRLHPGDHQPAAKAVRDLLTDLEADPATAAALGELDEAQLLAALVQRARRQADLDELRTAVEDQKTSEGDLQKLVERMTWIFGGDFLPGTVRRNLTLQDQLDLALLRPDGTLHGIELKKAAIKRLVVGHRNHLIVGTEVNKAVGQAMNYLRELDEKRPQILVDLGIDCRRASMTVVIGHSRFVDADVGSGEVDEAIRTFNSHLTRVSITTYDRLIENAQRAIELTAPNR